MSHEDIAWPAYAAPSLLQVLGHALGRTSRRPTDTDRSDNAPVVLIFTDVINPNGIRTKNDVFGHLSCFRVQDGLFKSASDPIVSPRFLFEIVDSLIKLPRSSEPPSLKLNLCNVSRLNW